MEVVNYHQFLLRCEKYPRDKRKIMVLSDKGKSEYRANNVDSKLITAMIVDGCLIKDGEKCDYLLLVCNDLPCKDKDAYLIELKGSDVIKAINQIDKTIEVLKDKLRDFNKVFGRIVPTRVPVPNLRNQAPYVNLDKKLKKMNGNLRCEVKLIDKI